jgi:uncharacterized protein (DUF427 family)
MSLTMGTGPFGHAPAGRFNLALPHEGILFSDPTPRRIRAVLGGRTVLDSRRARLLHEHGRLPRYFVPREDVRWQELGDITALDPPAGAPELDGHVAFPFAAMDGWFEEDDEIISHAPDPYHRVDVRNTSRHVAVSLDGVPLVDTTRARVIFETGQPPRWYVPREEVLVELEPSDLRTTCAYKGHARYWSARVGDRLVENLFWSYADPLHDAAAVQDLLACFNEQVDIDLDGERQPRPRTPWSAPQWWLAPGPPR